MTCSYFVYLENLVEDLGSRQMTMKTQCSGHAEPATHLASGLTADAQGLAFPVRNHHRLHHFAFGDGEKIFFRPVLRGETVGIRDESDLIMLRKPGTGRLGQVGHLIDGPHLLGIEPGGNLLGRKGRQTRLGNHFFQLLRRQPQ